MKSKLSQDMPCWNEQFEPVKCDICWASPLNAEHWTTRRQQTRQPGRQGVWYVDEWPVLFFFLPSSSRKTVHDWWFVCKVMMHAAGNQLHCYSLPPPSFLWMCVQGSLDMSFSLSLSLRVLIACVPQGFSFLFHSVFIRCPFSRYIHTHWPPPSLSLSRLALLCDMQARKESNQLGGGEWLQDKQDWFSDLLL